METKMRAKNMTNTSVTHTEFSEKGILKERISENLYYSMKTLLIQLASPIQVSKFCYLSSLDSTKFSQARWNTCFYLLELFSLFLTYHSWKQKYQQLYRLCSKSSFQSLCLTFLKHISLWFIFSTLIIIARINWLTNIWEIR